MRKISGIVRDLARHPVEEWAVVLKGNLLPIRFARAFEAQTHLDAMIVEMERPKSEEFARN